MIVSALRKLFEGQHLAEEESYAVMTAIMEGEASPVQVGALLGALRVKRETIEELTGFARAMRDRAVRVVSQRRPLLDTCGTGGDGCDTFNISTTAAFVIAAAGIAVAKHGNRAVSSRCGSADVLTALGVDWERTPQQIADCIDTVGIGFMFAPSHHPALKNLAQMRRDLGVRTAFNVLGPLTNPAQASRQLIGVFDPEFCPRLAEVLGRLGCERAMVVHGIDGLDEISTFGPTRISTLQQGQVETKTLLPEEFGIVPPDPETLRGGADAEENAAILQAILQGEQGSRRDIVCVNAAAGLILGGAVENWQQGIALAQRKIDSGDAHRVLNQLIEFTQACRSEIL